MTDIDIMTTRVASGAIVMDSYDPKWAEKIALDRLAIESCDRCILGQVFGSYRHGIQSLFGQYTLSNIENSAECGFTCGMSGTYEERLVEMARLADLWRAEVRARLAAAGEGSAT